MGQWHRADHNGIGLDRTVATGTGYSAQYPAEIAQKYESTEATPDGFLLFFHHVPYTHALHSGKTVIQHIYDSHYDGAREAATYPEKWTHLRGLIDDDRFKAVLDRLEYQAGHAIVWRDAVCNWFLRESGIPDAQKRVGNHPDRIEAEALTLEGYQIEPISPWEDASGGKAISCPNSRCSASLRFTGKPGWYQLSVQYFDQNPGTSHFESLVGNQVVGRWSADRLLPTRKPDAHSSTRHTVSAVGLRTGDEIRIVGKPDGEERAVLDFIGIKPVSFENPLQH